MYKLLANALASLARAHAEQRHMWPKLSDGRINWVQRKHLWAVKNYGKVDHYRQMKLKKIILAQRPKDQRGLPRLRYKLRTRKVKFCGYVFTEWH